jgi:hypothetical protein
MNKMTFEMMEKVFRTQGQYLTKQTGMRIAKWETWYELYGKGITDTIRFKTVADIRKHIDNQCNAICK